MRRSVWPSIVGGNHAAPMNGEKQRRSSTSCVGGISPKTWRSAWSKEARVIVTGRLEQQSWETENGERRSRVEVTAEEVGPSLRFATAEISRNERRGPEQAGQAGNTDVGGAEVVGIDA